MQYYTFYFSWYLFLVILGSVAQVDERLACNKKTY